MLHKERLVGTIVGLLVIFTAGTARIVMAQTHNIQLQDSSGSIVGTLSYSVNLTTGQCPTACCPPTRYANYSIWNFGNFAFQETKGQGVGPAWALGGAAGYTQGPGGQWCPTTAPQPSSQVTLTGGYGFTVTFNPCPGYTCSGSLSDVPAGYISPKYIIAAEVYAPPGNQSSVTYGTALQTGNTTSFSSSFKSSTTVTTSGSIGFSLSPFTAGILSLGGKTTGTWTQQSSQSMGSSGSFTTDLKTASSYTTYGGPITWSGWWTSGFNPHDDDYAWLWLNPVLPFQAPTMSTVTWFGYGFDMCDPVLGTDIYNVENGALENSGGGALPTFAALTTSAQKVLSRCWANPTGATCSAAYYISLGEIPTGCHGENFASGDTPALAASDYPKILAADPLLSQSYTLSLQSPGYITTGDGRYTRASAFINPSNGQIVATQMYTDFPFAQCGFVGCTPNSETYSATYTSSSQLGTSTDYEYTQTYGVDTSFTNSNFLYNLDQSLSTSNSITSDFGTKNDITNSTSNYGQFTIVGPPCTAGGSPCAQVYAGPGEFDVYQDNKFGTFMFWPVQ